MVERKWVREGMERFGRYFGRKRWFGFYGLETVGEESGSVGVVGVSKDGQGEREYKEMVHETEKRWRVGEKGRRILVEVATAYAITKVLLPARILLSIWGAPWFARVVVGRIGGLFGIGKGEARLGSKIVASTTSARVVTKGVEGAKKMI